MINDSFSSFFRPTRGIGKGCPLSPFLFILVIEALSRLIHNTESDRTIVGVKVSNIEEITHTLFVDDVLLFGKGLEENLRVYTSLLDKYKRATWMLINIGKSSMTHNEFIEELAQQSKEILSYPTNSISTGFKYLGFFLKPNSYAFQYWVWLYQKVEARVSSWENWFLSRGGILVLIKVVLQSNLVYWESITYIPKGILAKIRKKFFAFLWTTSKQNEGIH